MSWGSKVALVVATAAMAACSTPLPPLRWVIPADKAYVMPTGSMEPTLQIGDRIFVEFVDHPNPLVERGDIVAFAYPMDETQTYLKRVVGVPGDRIKLRDKQLILNGRPVEEPYAVHEEEYVDNYRDNFPAAPHSMQQSFDPAIEMLENHVDGEELVVPEGRYFVLGDNRDRSLDSRYFGFVADDSIIGKPWLIYYAVELDDAGESVGVNWSRIGKAVEGYPLGERR